MKPRTSPGLWKKARGHVVSSMNEDAAPIGGAAFAFSRLFVLKRQGFPVSVWFALVLTLRRGFLILLKP